MTKKGVTSTDAGLVGNLPTTLDDAQVRSAEIGRLMPAIDQVEFTDPAVLTRIHSFKAQAIQVASPNSEVDQLDEHLTACLEQLRGDFDRGIVRVKDKGTEKIYRAGLEVDKTAGQTWEGIKARLLANNAKLLRKAAAMLGGACLIGVYKNGELAIRQRSQEIMNARWTKDWEDGESDRGELRLLPHAEAVALPNGRWANGVEIVRAVECAGYDVPAYSEYGDKGGLVAASEVVTGDFYVMSPDRRSYRMAVLEYDENGHKNNYANVVSYHIGHKNNKETGAETKIEGTYLGNSFRTPQSGAVLWLRG